MKIIYLYQHFVLPEKHGITRTYEFAKRLSGFGHEVHLIAADESLISKENKPYVTSRDGITIHWLPIPYENKMSFSRRIFSFIQYILGAFKIGTSLSADVIYVSSPPLTSIIPALLLSKTKKVPMVLEVRDLWPDLPILFKALTNPISMGLAKWLERLAYKHATHVVALSPGIQRAVIARGVPHKQTSLIPNSCDFDFFKTQTNSTILQSHITESDFVVLYPGTIGVANNVTYIVKLAAETLKICPKLKFLVVGEGKEKAAVKNLALELGILDRNIFFLDAISKKDIPAVFKRADIVINTLVDNRFLWNSSPNKFFDALAAGKPVAINFKGWLSEIIEAHECGLVLDPKDIYASAQKLVNAITLPLWAQKAGKNGFQVGKKYFERKNLAILLHSILIEVTQTKLENQATLRKVSR